MCVSAHCATCFINFDITIGLENNAYMHVSNKGVILFMWFYIGYAPSNNLEQAQADAVVDQCQDLIDQFVWLYFAEQDPERKVYYSLF